MEPELDVGLLNYGDELKIHEQMTLTNENYYKKCFLNLISAVDSETLGTESLARIEEGGKGLMEGILGLERVQGVNLARTKEVENLVNKVLTICILIMYNKINFIFLNSIYMSQSEKRH